MAFQFRENGRHETDRQTDRVQRLMRSPREGRIIISTNRTALVLQANCTAVDGEWRLVLDPTALGFHYDTLGRIIRSNVVRGTEETYDRGVTQSDFNESVFSDRHHQQQQQGVELQASQHHKQRDDLSTFYSRCFVSFQYYHCGFSSHCI